MEAKAQIIKVTLEKKGRKYWSATLHGKYNDYSCKVIINDFTKNMEAGSQQNCRAHDLSTENGYGKKLVFELISEETWREEQEVAKYSDLFESAEAQAFSEWHSYATEAIKNTLNSWWWFEKREDVISKERFKAFSAKVDENIKWWKEEARKDRVAQEEERAARKKERAMRIAKRFIDFDGIHENEAIRYKDKIVVVTGHGKKFRYNYEDDGCNLPWHDGDWVSYAYYRDATPEEIADFEKREAKDAEAQKERQSIATLKDRIIQDIAKAENYIQTETPIDFPSGEMYFDNMNIYGGGECLLSDDRYIYYIRNNGMDGDFWGNNNVRTGGAGAIGYRIPRDEKIILELRKVKEFFSNNKEN